MGGSDLRRCGSDVTADVVEVDSGAEPDAGRSGPSPRGCGVADSLWAEGLVVEAVRSIFGLPAGGWGVLLAGFCSFAVLSEDEPSLTGPRTLFATVASWDTTRSMPLSAAGGA